MTAGCRGPGGRSRALDTTTRSCDETFEFRDGIISVLPTYRRRAHGRCPSATHWRLYSRYPEVREEAPAEIERIRRLDAFRRLLGGDAVESQTPQLAAKSSTGNALSSA